MTARKTFPHKCGNTISYILRQILRGITHFHKITHLNHTFSQSSYMITLVFITHKLCIFCLLYKNTPRAVDYHACVIIESIIVAEIPIQHCILHILNVYLTIYSSKSM